MTKADVPQVGDLLRRYLARFDVAQTFSKDEEISHWFLSGQGRDVNGERVEQVVWAYVVEVSRGNQVECSHHRTQQHILSLISSRSIPSHLPS